MKAWICQNSNGMYSVFLEKPIKDSYNWNWTYSNLFNSPPKLFDYDFVKVLIQENNIDVTYENSPVEIDISIKI